MANAEHDEIESKRAEVAAWLASGLDIDITPPTAGDPAYTAMLPELAIVGAGATEDEALDALMAQLGEIVAAHMLNGSPLPDRRKQVTIPQIRR